MSEKGKTSSEVNTEHGAIGPFAGFQYQYFYFILKLLEMNDKGESVGFEYYDDVDTICDGKLKYHQLKHTIYEKRKLTLCDLDLWKSIYVWLDIIEKEKCVEHESMGYSEFSLVSNKLSDENGFCKNVKRFKKGEIDFGHIRNFIRDLKEKSQNEDLKKYLRKIESSNKLEYLLRRVSFECITQEELLEKIKFRIRNIGIKEVDCDDATNSFIGEIETKWFESIQSGERPRITIDEIISIKEAIVAKYSGGKKFRGKRNFEIDIPEENLTDQLFIKQLLSVHDISPDDKEEIIEYTQQVLDYTKSVASMRDNHTILNEDFVNLNRDAYRYWREKFRHHYKNVDCNDEEQICSRASDLLNDIRDKELNFAGSENIETYFSNGLFYSLSNGCNDEYAIGWHLKWNELFKDKQ
jgi:hypothetical protein